MSAQLEIMQHSFIFYFLIEKKKKNLDYLRTVYQLLTMNIYGPQEACIWFYCLF